MWLCVCVSSCMYVWTHEHAHVHMCVCGVRVFMCTYMNLYLHVDTCSLCA